MENTYYYHGDHLGSCSWITDGEGSPVEYISYLPYGELLHHKRFDVSTYVERYTFTGKEKDEESGYYYFGARYFDAMLLTSWLSIDPVVKYNESPYLMCGGNPIRMVDPDGRDWYQSEDGATCWKNSSDKSISVNGSTYNNIGANYSHTEDNATYDYNQNNLERITYRTNPNFYEQVTSKDNEGCKQKCDLMLGSVGVQSTRENEVLMTTHDANGVVNGATRNYQKGINVLGENIMDGKPCIVGIDYKTMQTHNFAPNGDGMTDHFITVMGMIIDIRTGKISFRFYDPGSETGNRDGLFIIPEGGFLTGHTASWGKKFKVTTVRHNKNNNR